MTIWRDMKVWNDHLYVTDEGVGGLNIFDLSTLPFDTNLTTSTYFGGGWGSAHNLYIDENGICYIFGASTGNSGVIFLDLTQDPMNPVQVGQWDPFYAHDGMARGDTLYVANVYEGYFSVLDVSDKSNPVVLATQTTGNSFCHNVWVSDDGDHLFTTDEVSSGYLGAYDISDLGDIQEIDLTISDFGSNTIVHNTHFKDDYLITSYYTYGVTIHDVSRPHNMIEVGHYDTSPASGSGFSGCWGVYPFLPSENILATDIETGLYILDPTYQRACWLEGNISDANTSMPISSALVQIQSIDLTDVSSLSGDYTTGYHTAGTYTVEVSASGYEPAIVSGVQLANGQVTNLDVQLTPLTAFVFTGQVTEAGSGNPIENAVLAFRSTFYNYDVNTDASGNYSITTFYESDYEVSIGHWGHVNECASGFYDAGNVPLDFVLEVGYHDDFSVELDWEISGNAFSGVWARGVPQGQAFPPWQIAPLEDITWDCGTEAFITGVFGPVGAGAVSGTTILTSPVFDATTIVDPRVSFFFWYTNISLGAPVNDPLNIELSNGIDTVLVEAITPATNEMMDWYIRDIIISDHIAVTSEMRLHLTAIKPQTSDPELLEVAIDLFRVTGESVVSVEEHSAANINVYPNPTNGSIIVDLALKAGETMDLELLDLSGRIVLQKSKALMAGNNQVELDLPKGIYLLNAFNAERSLSPVRIVVQ